MNEIYLHQNGEQTGPHTAAEVRLLLAEGKATPETLAWHEGLTEWTTVAKVLGAASSSATVPPPPASTATAPPAAVKKAGLSGCAWAAIIVACLAVVSIPILGCLAGVALGPITAGIAKAKESASMQTTRAIALAMFQYQTDHHGAYPDGKTSTEVFQKLLDANYISDPDIFYIKMPGKKKGVSKTLTAENVCYDVTLGVTDQSPGSVPVVFCTGYTITYAAGASAIRNNSMPAPFPGPARGFGGIAVAYRDNSARWIDCDPQGSIPGFIPETFSAGSDTYRQLRP